MNTYQSAEGYCELCDVNCVNGCTGPLNTIGNGACNNCALVVYNDENVDIDGTPVEPVKCLHSDAECAEGFYKGYIKEKQHAVSSILNSRLKYKICIWIIF